MSIAAAKRPDNNACSHTAKQGRHITDGANDRFFGKRFFSNNNFIRINFFRRKHYCYTGSNAFLVQVFSYITGELAFVTVRNICHLYLRRVNLATSTQRTYHRYFSVNTGFNQPYFWCSGINTIHHIIVVAGCNNLHRSFFFYKFSNHC